MIKTHIHILKLFIKRGFKVAMMESRNFYFLLAAFVVFTLGNILMLQTAFTNVKFIGAWNFYNVLALYATYRITRGTYGLFIGNNLNHLFNTIRAGKLDLFLIKPASAWFVLSFQSTDIARLSDITSGILIFIYTLFFIHWSWFTLLLYIAISLIALVLLTCTNVLVSITAFYNIRDTILEFMEKLLRSTSQFPLRFANDTLQFLFTWLLPIMFLTTIPVEVLENRINLLWAFGTGLSLTAVYIMLTRFCWQRALKRYSSASS